MIDADNNNQEIIAQNISAIKTELANLSADKDIFDLLNNSQ